MLLLMLVGEVINSLLMFGFVGGCLFLDFPLKGWDNIYSEVCVGSVLGEG